MIDWKKVSENYAYRGWRHMIQRRFEMPDGRHADFDVIGVKTFVTIAAFTPKREAIIVRQFRPGPEMILTSFPEGLIDPRESPEMTARRELLEETGYEAGHILLLKEVRSAYTTERQVILLASDCHKVAAQRLDSTEFIEVFTLPFPEFRKLLRNAEDTCFTTVDAGYLALDRLGWL